MNTRQFQVEEEYFQTYLELSPEEQPDFLVQLQEENPEIGTRLRALIDAWQSQGHTEEIIRTVRHHVDKAVEEDTRTIGAYRILAEVGEGAIGVVYAALQQQPVRRLVALKVLKPGMDSREVIRRFDGERAALARMDHPNIAAVLDAGITEEGRPYFVMPLVQGPALTVYCDQSRLSIKDRIAVFEQVCRGVCHAHQRGLVHRDLKPGNILVVSGQAEPVVKVIDFGIAKAVDGTEQLSTFHTEHGHMLGTPGYMSPEQAAGATAGVDTRSDVYSLGVILYELLCGQLPHDPKQFRVLGPAMWARVVGETQPPTPSMRVRGKVGVGKETGGVGRTGGVGGVGEEDDSQSVAELRGTTSRQLQRALMRDIDKIVMRCIEPNPEQRYQTVDALVEDLNRWEAGLPVRAATTGNWYIIEKFVRRHRTVVAASVVLVLSLVVGAGAMAWFGYKIRQEANRRLVTAAVLNELIGGMSGSTDLEATRIATERMVELNEKGLTNTDLSAPEFRAERLHMAGVVSMMTDRPDLAVYSFEKAEALRLEQLGEWAPATMETQLQRARALIALGRAEEAVEVCEQLLKNGKGLSDGFLGACHEIIAVGSLSGRGEEKDEAVKGGEAVEVGEVVEVGETGETGERGIESARKAVAYLLKSSGDALSEEVVRARVVEVRCQVMAGKSAAVLAECRQLVEAVRSRYGAEHGLTQVTEVALGECLLGTGEAQKAEEVVGRGVAGMMNRLGPDHSELLEAREVYSRTLMALKRRYEAAEHLSAVYHGYSRTRGVVAKQTERALTALQKCLLDAHRFGDLKDVLLQAHSMRAAKMLGPDGKPRGDKFIARLMLHSLRKWGKLGEMSEWWKFLEGRELTEWKKITGDA